MFLHAKGKNMSEKFTVKDREELERLIRAMIDRDGPNCDLNFIDVSKVTDMSNLFGIFGEFKGNISEWDVSNVTNMSGMFDFNEHFNGDLSQWNVSNVTDMGSMFDHAHSFNGDISNWNVSNVTNMREMFDHSPLGHNNWPSWYLSYMCRTIAHDRNELEQLIQDTIENHGPNCNLNFIDVSQVTDMSKLFHQTALVEFNGDISLWDVSNVTNMHMMFCYNSHFNGDISKWNVSNVKNMESMFDHAYRFNGDLSQWDVSNVTNMDGMFDHCHLTPPAWYSNRANPSNNNVSEQENTDDSIGDYIELNDIVL